jgi:hypothetical protein
MGADQRPSEPIDLLARSLLLFDDYHSKCCRIICDAVRAQVIVIANHWMNER